MAPTGAVGRVRATMRAARRSLPAGNSRLFEKLMRSPYVATPLSLSMFALANAAFRANVPSTVISSRVTSAESNRRPKDIAPRGSGEVANTSTVTGLLAGGAATVATLRP